VQILNVCSWKPRRLLWVGCGRIVADAWRRLYDPLRSFARRWPQHANQRPLGRNASMPATGHFQSFEQRAEIHPNRTLEPMSRWSPKAKTGHSHWRPPTWIEGLTQAGDKDDRRVASTTESPGRRAAAAIAAPWGRGPCGLRQLKTSSRG